MINHWPRTRRWRFLSLLGILVATAAWSDERTNFVLLIADDVSVSDWGCYGHPVIRTPHIDALAERGLRFENAYLTTSSCSPCRASLITGRYPHNTGAPELHTPLPADQILFPARLQEAGYHTVMSGKNHMGNHVKSAFSVVSPGRGPGKQADWVELLQQRPPDQPFFFWFAASDAHRNWTFTDHAPRYDPDRMVVPPWLVDGPRTREDLASYAHEVSRFDHFVGEVCNELVRQGVFDNTVVMVMADNGRPFPRCKTRLYDSGIKTPLVICCPDRFASATCRRLVSTIDLAPTIMELAGVGIPREVQGVSLLPLLREPDWQVRDVVFAEHNWHVYRNHERMVRHGDWVYIRNRFPNQQNLCVEAYCGGAGEELWEMREAGQLNEIQLTLFRNPCPEHELFYLPDDPQQLRNLAADPVHRTTLEQLQGLLSRWEQETGDTFPRRPTPDRDAPPDRPALDRDDFKRGEMPGQRAAADKIDRPGPVFADR